MQLAAEFPIGLVCRVLRLARSSYYYRSQRADDSELRSAVGEEAAEWPAYGYRRITNELRRKGWVVNEKKVRRLMREMNLQVRRKGPRRATTDSRHHLTRYPNLIMGLEITRPDQVWASDITYIRLRREFVYLAVIMDVFTRAVRGWNLSRSLDHSLTLDALEMALADGRPETHHSDQGVQYAAVRYVETLVEAGIQISMAEVGQPTQNPHVERVIRTIKEEEVDLSDYDNFHEAYSQIGRFIEEVYMYKRGHSSLGYLTPVEYELQWQSLLGDEPDQCYLRTKEKVSSFWVALQRSP